MSQSDKLVTSFNDVAQHFSDREPYLIDRVVVPTNDANVEISFRKDAMSNERLVLEISEQRCGACPTVSPLPGSGLTTFFQSEYPCVQTSTENGGTTVLEPIRCQHFVVKNSPRALAESLRSLADSLSSDAQRRLYVEKQKRTDEELERYAIGERFAPATLADLDPALLSDEERTPPSLGYVYGIIGAIALILLVTVAIFVVRLLRKRSSAKSRQIPPLSLSEPAQFN